MELRETPKGMDFQGRAPEWVQIIPAGPEVKGRDGRAWTFGPAEAQAVLAAFRGNNGPLPVDWEHSSETRAPKGEEAPAAGWITALEVRGGSLWGRVEWTPRAAGQIANREYRFLSPVFCFSRQDGKIKALVSAGLTNSPNLPLLALNRQEGGAILPAVPLYGAGALDETALAVCRAMGVDPEDYARSVEAEAAQADTFGLSEQELAVCRSLGVEPEDYARERDRA